MKTISLRTLFLVAICALLPLSAQASKASKAAKSTAQKVEVSRAQSSASQSPGHVNLNTAGVDQLIMLPGIGPSKARAIIVHREKRPFRRKSQLMNVRGIGAKTLRRLRPYISVTGPTTLREKISPTR